MATSSDIQSVRRATDEITEDTYSDEVINVLIDAKGVTGTISQIWEEKAASLSTATDVTEAGASHKFSSLYTNAAQQAKYWATKFDAETSTTDTSGRPKVKKIVRS